MLQVLTIKCVCISKIDKWVDIACDHTNKSQSFRERHKVKLATDNLHASTWGKNLTMTSTFFLGLTFWNPDPIYWVSV